MATEMEFISPPQCPTTVTIRRNPHRKARPTTATAAAKSPSTQPLSSKTLNIPNFPIDDILSIDVQLQPQNPTIPSSKALNLSKSLNVFLRIRPLPTAPSKSKQPKPKKSIKSCLTINDPQSVTIIPPICDSNRLKSEIYNGFSHVFSSDSSQDEVYEKLMKPMVEEFLNGRSALLAALGPSGSGKTHTVFGSVREPGLVPRALRHIFERGMGKLCVDSRSFYLSIFEIYSEKGKGEKLSDLSPDGSDIYMQQSTIKGLKEILVRDVAQAESLLAHAKSKRATAMTNSNSQSSRSQCIINIRCAADKTEGESDFLTSEAVLTFVDLAGAEREKKTGNKGGRLLESNFINNTSMVFGLCLRSLLEHQKNPKKPLQKHFQSSLLTKYLRDYLEGRKRMALILTVRSGEEDYFDTSFLLRQASPFMEIKFCDMEETSNLPRNKKRRQIAGNEQKKRVKLTSTQGQNDVAMITMGSETIQKKEAEIPEISDGNKGFPTSRADEDSHPEINCCVSDIHRQYYFMQGFAKALWVMLKRYKERVKIMQEDIDILTENLRSGNAKYLVMEEEILYLKSQCSCPKQVLGVANCSMGGPSSESKFREEELIDHGKVISAEIQGLADLECNEEEILHTSGGNCTHHEGELVGGATPEESCECSVSEYKTTNVLWSSEEKSEEPHVCSVSACKTTNLSSKKDLHFEGEVGYTLTPEAGCQWTSFEGRPATNPDLEKESQPGSIKNESPELQGPGSTNVSKIHLGDLPLGPTNLSVDGSIDSDVILTTTHKANLSSTDLKVPSPHSYQLQQSPMECRTSYNMSKNDCHEKDQSKEYGTQTTEQTVMECQTSLDMSKINCHEKDQRKECDTQSTDAAAHLSRSHAMELIDQCGICDLDTPKNIDKENAGNDPGNNSKLKLETKETLHSNKPSGRPKRRLMPASSLLLRDAGGSIEATDDNVKLRGGRDRRKLVEDEHKRTKGNATLKRLLTNHLPR